jgi:hypothetical protein
VLTSTNQRLLQYVQMTMRLSALYYLASLFQPFFGREVDPFIVSAIVVLGVPTIQSWQYE